MITDEMRALRDQAHEPEVLLRPDGAYLNLPMVRRVHGAWDAMAGLTLDGSGFEWHEIGGQACVRIEDLAALFAAGTFGQGDMMRGRLRIFRLLAPADFRNLPFPSGLPAGDGYTYNQAAGTTLRARFDLAALELRQAANNSALGDPSVEVHELPAPVRCLAWVGKGGDPRRGPEVSLEAALPIEIGWDNHRRVVLYTRSLKGAAAGEEAQAAVAGE